MKLSRAEWAAVGITAVTLVFCLVRFALDMGGEGYTVSTQYENRVLPSASPRVYVLDRPVDVNTADLGDLTALSGIGQTKALAILKYREQNGPFATVDELLNVPGIGPATLEAIRGDVTLSQPG